MRRSPSPSADRLGQVLSGSAVLRAPADTEGRADSAPFGQAATVVSAANHPPQSAVSEGVASAGAAPQPLLGEFVGEFVPSAGGEVATHSLAAGYQGETSGLHDGGTGGGSTYGFGETAAGGSRMEVAQQPGTASAQQPGVSHYASRAGPEAGGGTHHQAKRKMSEMGEVEGEQQGDAGGPAVGMVESEDEQTDGGGFNRVPSDLAMVLGDTFEEPAGGGGLAAGLLADSAGMLPDDCDSNMARAIQASLDDARRQQEAAAAAAGAAAAATGGGGGAAAPGEAVMESTAGEVPQRPSDADIIAFENRIREEEVKTVPLMGDREPLAALAAEYADGSQIYRQKIEKLGETYGSIRRTRGDGNCFYRSFLFGYLEHLLLSPDGGGERDRAMGRLEALKKELTEVGGYDEIVLETPVDMVLQLLRGVGSPLEPLTIEGLETTVRDEEIGPYALWLLRMITSCEVKRRADFFAPFIMGLSDLDVATFCSKCVDPMGEEADHVQLVALTDALQVPIRVVYLDRSLAPGGGTGGTGSDVHVDMHDFVPESCPPPGAPRVHLLYRPGHYDLLYPTHG